MQAALEKVSLFYLFKNFMRPIFFKKKKIRPGHDYSPAMRIGVASKILSFRDIFRIRDKRNETLAPKDWSSTLEVPIYS